LGHLGANRREQAILFVFPLAYLFAPPHEPLLVSKVTQHGRTPLDERCSQLLTFPRAEQNYGTEQHRNVFTQITVARDFSKCFLISIPEFRIL
jgi:hypothetical protein